MITVASSQRHLQKENDTEVFDFKIDTSNIKIALVATRRIIET